MIDPCSLDLEAMLSVEEARKRIAEALVPVAGMESVSLRQALGRVLAEPVYSPLDLPHDRNSAVDGYAFDSRDADGHTPFRLRLAGVAWAGRPFQGSLAPGECIRIFTGAVVPDQADSVAMQEFVTAEGNTITFPSDTPIRRFVREAGEDLRCGQLLCAEGRKLTAVELALLAAAGLCEVKVRRPVRIAFFSTGDELVGLGQPLAKGQVYDSNRYLLGAFFSDPCFRAVDLGVIVDDPLRIEAALTNASLHYDVLMTTGGASVGEADFIAATLARLGRVIVRKIAMKPGKPLLFGTLGNAFFFGLSGNPVSAAVTLQQIVMPALQQLAGIKLGRALRVKAKLAAALKKEAGRAEFQRGALRQDAQGEFIVSAVRGQGSHMLGALADSNCYIVLPAESCGAEAGEWVWVEPMRVRL